MFLEGFMESKEGRNISKLARESTTFNTWYLYWRDELFERVMRLFVWEGTDDDLDPKEIEQRLHLAGHLGITKIPRDNKLTAMYGSFFGVTKYLDEFTGYTVRCPIYSGQRTIGKDVVVISNSSLRNPTYELVHHYAVLLAHCEVSIVDSLVNCRDSGGIPVANTEKQKQSIQQYQGKVYNGEYGVVTDIGNLGINYLGGDRKTQLSIMELYEVRERLLKSFYSDIGVRSAFEKRSNTIQSEVEADSSLLLLNLSDMLEWRKKGAEEVNKMFGKNWSVHIADEISYGVENQREAFSSSTELHIRQSDVETKEVKE